MVAGDGFLPECVDVPFGFVAGAAEAAWEQLCQFAAFWEGCVFQVSGDLDQGGVADGGDHDGVGARGVNAVACVFDAGACAVGAEEQDVESWGVFPGVFGVCVDVGAAACCDIVSGD